MPSILRCAHCVSATAEIVLNTWRKLLRSSNSSLGSVTMHAFSLLTFGNEASGLKTVTDGVIKADETLALINARWMTAHLGSIARLETVNATDIWAIIMIEFLIS